MKNIIKSTLLLAVSVCLFSACDKDLENNPTLQSPSTFKLNQPAYAEAGVDLSTSENLNFSWSQPDYGFPAAVTYQMQVSTKNQWTISQAEADADKEGKTIANYASLGNTYTAVKGSLAAADVAKAIEQQERFAADAVPATQDLYVRVMAVYSGDTIYSNAQKLMVKPYYVELRDADPVIYYLIGGTIADGKWTNSADAIGTSMEPMYTMAGESYDKVTGKGKIEYAGYFLASQGFKIVFTPGNWDYGICGGGEPGKTSVRDGGADPGNITVPEDGYYDIVVNTNDNSCTITKMKEEPKLYPSMFLAGDFNGWGHTGAMSAIDTFAGAKNHNWVATFDMTDGGAKFVEGFDGDSWLDNWGASTFPRGIASTAGNNIPVKAGKYKVFFNDILKAFSFVEQK